jgi:hypothetical protein
MFVPTANPYCTLVLRSWTSQHKEKWHRMEYFSQNNRLKYPGAWLLFSQWQTITSVGVYIAWCCHVTQCKNRLDTIDVIKVHNKLSRHLPILWNSCRGIETYINADNNNWMFKYYLLRIVCEGTQGVLSFYVKGLKVSLVFMWRDSRSP